VTNYTRHAYLFRLVAYLGVAVASSVGFWRVEVAIHHGETALARVEEVRHDADLHLCRRSNQDRRILLQLIERSARGGTPPPSASPELVEAYRLSAERAEEFRAYASAQLAEQPCTLVVPKAEVP
jgi:hypothetical protein